MANKEWEAIDNQKYNFEDYYCAFLDMLGYKNKMKAFFNNEYNLYGRVQRAMHGAGVEPSPQESPDGVVTHIFSDSIILTAKKKEVPIEIMLGYIGQLTFWFGMEGLFLRGGLSCGKLLENFGTEEGFSFLASEGLAKAYQLETQAVFPMIVIDEDILPDIQDVKSVIKNGNKYIFNHVRYLINEKASNEDNVIAELQEIMDKKNQLSDLHVREKYEWIINYYLWFVHESHDKYGRFDLLKFATFNREINEKYVFKEM
jgi:hypothetical protein